jgi:hypothetical protein
MNSTLANAVNVSTCPSSFISMSALAKYWARAFVKLVSWFTNSKKFSICVNVLFEPAIFNVPGARALTPGTVFLFSLNRLHQF